MLPLDYNTLSIIHENLWKEISQREKDENERKRSIRNRKTPKTKGETQIDKKLKK